LPDGARSNKRFLWFDSAPVVGTALVSNVATVMIANPGLFTTGQTVTVAGAGATLTAAIRLLAHYLLALVALAFYQPLIYSLTITNIHRVTALYSMQR
jgi:hypothetical protein